MINSYNELRKHLGHKIEIADYAGQNVSIECYNCSEVLVDYEREI